MRDYMAAIQTNLRLSQRYDALFLSHLIDSERFSVDWDAEKTTLWGQAVAERLNQASPASVSYGIDVTPGEEGFDLQLNKFTHGVTESKRIKRDFFVGPEYRLIGRLADTLFGLIQEGAKVIRGKSEQEISSFIEAYEWLMAESRKGRSIQRFKGLGEMNPEQLWDTTVNPETRRLLQVTIEDAVAADEIFTTLMGDEVEPRRNFIERHALDATNLDV